MALCLALGQVSTESVDNSVGKLPFRHCSIGLEVQWAFLAQFPCFLLIVIYQMLIRLN